MSALVGHCNLAKSSIRNAAFCPKCSVCTPRHFLDNLTEKALRIHTFACKVLRIYIKCLLKCISQTCNFLSCVLVFSEGLYHDPSSLTRPNDLLSIVYSNLLSVSFLSVCFGLSVHPPSPIVPSVHVFIKRKLEPDRLQWS